MTSTRLTLRERAWLPLEYIRTVGPFRGITVRNIQQALIGMHAAEPSHRAVSRLNRPGARWEHLSTATFAAWVQDAVTEGPADPDELSRLLLAEPRGAHPVRILVGGDHLAFKVAHAYGDAGPVNTLLREIVTAAAQGRAARLEPSPREAFALPRAWWHHLGRSPRRVAGSLRVDQPMRAVPVQTRAWRPDLTVRSTHSAQVLARMREWRDAYAPGVTTSAIAFAAFTSALVRLDLRPDLSGGVFLADARRYLPSGVTIDSNFCWGQFLSPGDLLDPRSIHAAIRTELASGRMLSMMALREGKLAMLGGAYQPRPYPGRVPTEPRPRLTFGNQGRHDLLADLPWSVGPADRVNHSVPTFADPEGMAIGTSEMNGVLHLDVTFHASTFEPKAVEQALELVCEDPAALIAVNH